MRIEEAASIGSIFATYPCCSILVFRLNAKVIFFI